jgi:hypothetical protein
LDAMKYNGNNNYYDAVALFEWRFVMKDASQHFSLS